MAQNLREGNSDINDKNTEQEENDEDFKDIEYKCKFSGILCQFELDTILKDYNDVIKMIINKNNEKELNLEEIKKIFVIKNDDKYTLKCYYSIFTHFISIILEFINSNNKNKKIHFSLKKTPYEFGYEGKKYYCFIVHEMSKFLEDIKTKKSFSVIIRRKDSKRISILEYSRNVFQFLQDDEFEIQIDYQYKGINFENINYKNIFNNNIIKKGSDLNLKLGLYINLKEEEFNKFEYFKTNERNNFMEYIQDKIKVTDVLGICGPYGSGKTVTLLKLIIESSNMNYLYINLSTVFKNDFGVIQEVLRYELIKLLREDIFEYECKDKGLNIDKNSIKQLINNMPYNIHLII